MVSDIDWRAWMSMGENEGGTRWGKEERGDKGEEGAVQCCQSRGFGWENRDGKSENTIPTQVPCNVSIKDIYIKNIF